ncbi:MAG: hypothetical protein AAF242_09160, partial [Bacteroidota bacterium]
LLANWATARNSIFPNVEMKVIGVSKKMKISISGLKQTAQISIKAKDGRQLLSETIKSNAFAKLYNLELLKVGDYYVHITNGQKELEQPFSITNTKLLMDDRKRREFLVPTVRLAQKKVNVMMLNTRMTNVKIQIKNEYGDILLDEELDSVVKVEKQYDIAALKRGRYQVVISTPEKTYYENFINK